MRFIEYWFAISPDNGSGALESALFALSAILLATLHVKCRLFAGRKSKSSPPWRECSNVPYDKES
jgi:hypothetical protein